MKKKNILFILILIFLCFLVLFYYKNEDSRHKISLNELKNPEKQEIKIDNKNTKNSLEHETSLKNEVKTKYNDKEFKKFLKQNALIKVPNSQNLFFVDHISVIEKRESNNPPKEEVLWQDRNYFYISSANSHSNFSQKSSLVLFNSDTSNATITNGFFIISFEKDLGDISFIEKKYQVNKISLYVSDKILIVRAKENTNIIHIYENLKSEKLFKTINLEIINKLEELK